MRTLDGPTGPVPGTLLSLVRDVADRPGLADLAARAACETHALACAPLGERNPDDHNRAEVVEVTTCALAEYPDLVLVDTLRLSSGYARSTAASTNWLRCAGVAVLTVPSTQPLGAADLGPGVLDRLVADCVAAIDAQIVARERLVGALDAAMTKLRAALAELDAPEVPA